MTAHFIRARALILTETQAEFLIGILKLPHKNDKDYQMIKQTYTVGESVEKFCRVCNERLGHIVKSVTKTGTVSKVSCSICGRLGTFKPIANLAKIQDLETKTGDPYSQSRTYRTGQIMAHPIFGTGEVITVFDTKTIDVLFVDRVRRLIHARI